MDTYYKYTEEFKTTYDYSDLGITNAIVDVLSSSTIRHSFTGIVKHHAINGDHLKIDRYGSMIQIKYNDDTANHTLVFNRNDVTHNTVIHSSDLDLFLERIKNYDKEYFKNIIINSINELYSKQKNHTLVAGKPLRSTHETKLDTNSIQLLINGIKSNEMFAGIFVHDIEDCIRDIIAVKSIDADNESIHIIAEINLHIDVSITITDSMINISTINKISDMYLVETKDVLNRILSNIYDKIINKYLSYITDVKFELHIDNNQ